MSEVSEPRWVTPEQLRASGWSRAQLRAAIRGRAYTQGVRGLWLPTDAAEDLYQRCARALATQRADAAISHETAAVIREFAWLPEAWRSPCRDIDITVARDDLTRSSRQGIHRRIAELPPQDVVLWRGLRVTSPARTAVDLARFEKSRLFAVQLLDGVLRIQHCTRDEMIAVLDRMIRVPWVRRARERVELSREGVDSPPETTVRLSIVDAGLPQPDVNLQLFSDGILLAQGDLGYWRWLIWIEYDGEEVHDPLRLAGKDQQKDRRLGMRGWETFRLTKLDVRSPGAFLRELSLAIDEGPRRVAALNPARSSEVREAQRLLAQQ